MDGERGRNRTFNLVIKSHLLCQLSYAPALEVGWKLTQLKLRQEPIIPSRGRMSPNVFRLFLRQPRCQDLRDIQQLRWRLRQRAEGVA